jgi:hypothetical protein
MDTYNLMQRSYFFFCNLCLVGKLLSHNFGKQYVCFCHLSFLCLARQSYFKPALVLTPATGHPGHRISPAFTISDSEQADHAVTAASRAFHLYRQILAPRADSPAYSVST